MSELTKVTVNMTPRATQALERAAALRGLNRTDTINHAVRLWLLVAETLDNGGSVYVRPAPGGEIERLVLL